ncbi:MAG TPA: Type 1 glutamine amidotransferase-like domain-containing protein [Acidimicrobiales bacterium]|jgi:cyanophycinase
MSGVLALAGDRPFHRGCSLDGELLEAAGVDEVLLVPTGAAYEEPVRIIQRAAAWFADLGAKVEALPLYGRSDALDPKLVDRIVAASFAYLVGDSPMHLRSVMKESPAWEAITSLWNQGGVLAAAGGSAMAICDPMVDPRGGAFTVGLGLIENVAVVAQSGWSADQAKRTIHLAPKDTAVVGIDAHAAVVRRPDGSWHTTGTGEVVVYESGAEQTVDRLP